jgi:hypothetical protein
VDGQGVRRVVETFYCAFLAGDREALAEVVAPSRIRLSGLAVVIIMRRRLTLLMALAAPFVLAGCGKGKY